jgi:hypothetical protein
MTEKSLEAMLRRASRMAETKFRRDGEVTVLWLAETAGRLHPMVPPEVPAVEAGHEREPAAVTQTRTNRGLLTLRTSLPTRRAP